MKFVFVVKVEVTDAVSDCEISGVYIGCSFEMVSPCANKPLLCI